MSVHDPSGLTGKFGNLLFEQTADPVFVVNHEGQFVAVNHAACDHTGYSRNKLLKMGTKDIERPFDKKSNARRIAQLKKNQKRIFRTIHIHRNGKLIPVEVNAALLELDGKSYSLNICRDISLREPAAEALLQELEVHQTELKMQNETLRDALCELEESRDRYVEFYDFAPAGYLSLDCNGLITEINLTGAAMLGVVRQNLKNRRFAPFISPEYSDKWYRHFLLALQLDSKQTCELEIRGKDDSRTYVQLDSLRLVIGGKTSGVRITLTDITVHRQAGMAALASEKRFHTLFDAISDAVFISIPNGKIIQVNEAACKILGYGRDELLQLTPLQVNLPQNAAKVKECRDTLINTGKLYAETVHVCKDGSLIPVEVNSNYVELDGQWVFITVARDIKRRRYAEEQTHFKAALLNAVGEAVVATDNKGIVTYVNSAAEDIYGWNAKETIGCHILDVMVPLVYQASEAAILNELVDGRMWSGTFKVKQKSGKIAEVEIRSTPFFEQHTQAGTILVSFDITKRMAAELALKESLRKLEEQEVAKTRFLAVAGHDLRQPITAANLFLHGLKMTDPTELQRVLIEKLDDSMHTFADLLEGLLDISKFDAGLVKPKFSPFNLFALFRWLEQNFKQVAIDRNLQFRLSFPMNKVPAVNTDIGLLKSVLMNLITNATKFTSHGGILVSARIRGNSVLFQVWDTGIGIDKAHLPKIYDEFYQVANTQRNRNAGLGLGLSICKRTMSLLGGEITCRSIKGRGTVFSFSLPLDSTLSDSNNLTIEENSFIKTETESKACNKRIVVLEDDEQVASAFVDFLHGMGAEVRHFSDAESALKHDDISRADLFIVDYSLGGGINGLEFLQALQQKQPKPITAVIITGETSPQFMRSIAECQWSVFHKPIDVTTLADYLCDLKNKKLKC